MADMIDRSKLLESWATRLMRLPEEERLAEIDRNLETVTAKYAALKESERRFTKQGLGRKQALSLYSLAISALRHLKARIVTGKGINSLAKPPEKMLRSSGWRAGIERVSPAHHQMRSAC